MSAPMPRRPICMIVHAYYEEDPRVRREAEALVAADWEVDVFGLRRPGETASAVIEGVNLRRLPVRRHQGAGLSVYLVEYGAFLMRALWAATRAHRRRRYSVVEVHSLPDYLVFSALPMKLAGVPVLLDLHEAMPEFFRSRFPRAANPISYRLLLLQEKLSIALANEVLTVNEPLAERLIRLGARPERLTVILNSPDLRLFDPTAHPRRRFMADGKLRIVYTGALTPTYELDVVLRAVASLARTRPGLHVEATFYGRGDAQGPLEALAAELGIAGSVSFPGRIPIEEVPEAVAAADIGVAPTRLDPFTQMSLSTKVLEYAAMAKPVVASRLPTVERYFDADTLAVYEPGDHESLAATILSLVDHPTERRARVRRTRQRVEDLSWTHQAETYLGVVGRMVTGPGSRRSGRNGRP
ncbi:MAG TPA: glycosyltransferase family 4 protein [Candidatus Limnocylindrales bacterium]|nr:glycosyltransferase family 4 protein [Candidatus Limnocylindrales bacterium]